jgi:hypothetical protein
MKVSPSDPVAVAYEEKIAQLEGANAELAAALSAALKRITKQEKHIARIRAATGRGD